MNFLGNGGYHLIKNPGDFAYRTEGGRRYLAMHCPKFDMCLIRIHQDAPDQANAIWNWDGNEAEPTIVPSIGCDIAPRCGQHRTISRGNY